MEAHQQIHTKEKKKQQNRSLQNRLKSRIFSLTLSCTWKSMKFCTCSLGTDFGSLYLPSTCPGDPGSFKNTQTNLLKTFCIFSGTNDGGFSALYL